MEASVAGVTGGVGTSEDTRVLRARGHAAAEERHSRARVARVLVRSHPPRDAARGESRANPVLLESGGVGRPRGTAGAGPAARPGQSNRKRGSRHSC